MRTRTTTRQGIKGYFEWGVMLDCESNGCDPHHADHGTVFPDFMWTPTPDNVNGHAVTKVKRHIGEWEPADG